MFDLSKIAEMSNLAKEARKIQKEQIAFQEKQLVLLQKISSQLEEVLITLREKREIK